MEDPVEVQLSRLVMQDKGESQYVHLRECEGERSFQIVIGFNEAWEIQAKLHKQHNRRPLTHDLIGGILAKLDCDVSRVTITELRDSTFYAVIVMRLANDETDREVDCRPSDAIAMAVQLGVPIYVARKVLDVVAQ